MPRRLSTLLAASLALAMGACAGVPAPAPETGSITAPAASRTAPTAAGDSEAATLSTPDAPRHELLETTRRWARSSAEWMARGVDGWFGDKPFDPARDVTDGRLSMGLVKRQDQTAEFDVRFNAHFKLPNVEQSAYLFVGRDDPRVVVKDKPEAVARAQALQADRLPNRSFLAGLGVSLRDSTDLRLGIGAGLKPYAQARFTHSWEAVPGHLIDVGETFFATRDDRLGSTTALSYEHAISPTLAARWLNVATITQVSGNFEWSSSLSVRQSLARERLLSFEMLFNGTGTQGSGVGASDRGLLARWEQPIYRDWLFCEVVGGHFWPRPDAFSERGRAWVLGGSLKLRF